MHTTRLSQEVEILADDGVGRVAGAGSRTERRAGDDAHDDAAEAAVRAAVGRRVGERVLRFELLGDRSVDVLQFVDVGGRERLSAGFAREHPQTVGRIGRALAIQLADGLRR